MSKKKVLIIGAGLGGIATAIRLAKHNFQITIVDKLSTPGGRSNVIEYNGYRVDTGPTILLMKHVFSDLYKVAGMDLEDRISIARLDPNYRLYFHDNSYFDLHQNQLRLEAELDLVERGASRAFRQFFRFSQQQYNAGMKYVERNYYSILDLISFKAIPELIYFKIHKSLYGHVSDYFRSDKLRKAFSFHSLFLGLSPYDAMAFYSLITFADIGLGMWYPKGGIYSIIEDMVQLAEDLGVNFVFSKSVSSININKNKASGVTLETGEYLDADIIVSNADLPYTYKQLLPPQYQNISGLQSEKDIKYACSGYLLYMGLDKQYKNAKHQSLYFAEDYETTIEDIFHRLCLPSDPSFHLSIPSVTDPSIAPPGHSVFYILVPVPNLTSKVDWKTAVNPLRENIITRLETLLAENIRDHIVWYQEYTPLDFKHDINAVHGTAFGSLSQGFFQTTAFRPKNKHDKIPNLYFVGQGTYPGIGMPMVLISAKLVVERICYELKCQD